MVSGKIASDGDVRLTNQVHSLIDKIVLDVRSLIRWLLLAIASPSMFKIASWWKSRKDTKTDGITPARKSFLERRKEIRDERKRRRNA